jgi:hypothetical protein
MRRAFVVQLNPQTSEDPWDGRIEHVDSGKSKHFHSLKEVSSFVEQVLSETQEEECSASDADVVIPKS